jgi:hypothetical protein
VKILQTLGYDNVPCAIPADRVLHVSEYKGQLTNPSGYERTALVMQDASADVATFIVNESYDTIIAKMQAL